MPDYVFLALLKNAKLEATRIAYRDFSPAYQDLHEGRLQVVVAGITNLIPHREKGTAKILAVVNRERAAFAPEIPTVAEAGFPELTFDSPVGLLCPARHGAFSRGRISADVRAITAEPAFRQQLINGGVSPRNDTPEQFAAAIADQRAKITAIHRSTVTKD